jgi:hypothetical protein
MPASRAAAVPPESGATGASNALRHVPTMTKPSASALEEQLDIELPWTAKYIECLWRARSHLYVAMRWTTTFQVASHPFASVERHPGTGGAQQAPDAARRAPDRQRARCAWLRGASVDHGVRACCMTESARLFYRELLAHARDRVAETRGEHRGELRERDRWHGVTQVQ